MKDRIAQVIGMLATAEAQGGLRPGSAGEVSFKSAQVELAAICDGISDEPAQVPVADLSGVLSTLSSLSSAVSSVSASICTVRADIAGLASGQTILTAQLGKIIDNTTPAETPSPAPAA